MPTKQLTKCRPFGAHAGIPMEEYLTMDAAGNSDLTNMHRSAAYCDYQRTQVSTMTPATSWGVALHARVLEPHLYETTVGILPEDTNLRTKDGRAFKAQLEGSREVVLTKAEGDRVELAAQSVFACPSANLLLNAQGPVEQTIVVADPLTGCPLKIRPDKLIPQKGIVLDLKTTRMPSQRAFTKQAFDLSYDRKMAFYRFVMNQLGLIGPASAYEYGVVIAVQNTEPFETCVYAIGGETLEVADASWRQDLNLFAECRESGVWPAFSPEIQTLELPKWARDIRMEGLSV